MTPDEQTELVRALAVYIMEQVDQAIEKRLKEFRHVGPYDADKKYKHLNMVQKNGSSWHCRVAETNSVPGESADWVLISKCGRDGKDAQPRLPTAPRTQRTY